MHAQVGNDTERTYVYNSQHERLWGMLLTINQDDIMEKQKNLPLTARLSTCRERMEYLPPSRLLKHNHVLPQTIWGNISGFIVSSSSTLCTRRMFILVLPHKENKLHPIYRTIKSQDNFTERSQYERLFPAFVLHYKQKQLTLQSNKQRDY